MGNGEGSCVLGGIDMTGGSCVAERAETSEAEIKATNARLWGVGGGGVLWSSHV